MSEPIDRLASIFEKFPGIGPRQAGRFVQYLLRNSSAMRRELADTILEIAGSVSQCTECMRYHSGKGKQCSICAGSMRDISLLAVVASDADLGALEKSGTYNGRYFVLGGTVMLGAEKQNGLRIKQLRTLVQKSVEKGLREIILAFPANPEGDATATYLSEEMNDFVSRSSGRITKLGRGLSTGSELEYADPETLKSALESRR